MIHNRKYNIFGWLSGAMLLLTTACATNDMLEVAQTDGTNTVTITVEPQLQAVAMRDVTNGEGSKIGTGSKADVLIFAVYDEDGNVLEEFQKDPSNTTLGKGQNIIENATFPLTIQLSVSKEKTYQVAFWAQSSLCQAYTTTDLKNVKVDYESAANNSELRDAFCASVTFSGTEKSVKAELRRPFSQINVGTTGWDYEGAAKLTPNGMVYTQSKIELVGVAQYYNVLSGNAVDDGTHATTNVTFDYAKLPAYIHYSGDITSSNYEEIENEEFLRVQRYKEEDLNAFDKKEQNGYLPYVNWQRYDDFLKAKGDEFSGKSYVINENGKAEEYNNEEEDTEVEKYTTAELYGKGYEPLTETYKYLSMCYALVPEVGENKSSLLSSLKFYIKGLSADDGPTTDLAAANEGNPIFELLNVPVQKNWRTNILGKDLFTIGKSYILDIVPEYCGDYNYDGSVWGNPTDGSSWPEDETYEVSFDVGDAKSPPCTGGDGHNVPNSFFQYEGDHNHSNSYKGKYNGVNYASGLKLEDYDERTDGIHYESVIKFTTNSPSTVIIVQSDPEKITGKGDPDWFSDATIKFDGVTQAIPNAPQDDDDNENVLVYTFKNVPAGVHRLTVGDSDTKVVGSSKRERLPQPGILYIKVECSAEDTKNGNDDFDDWDEEHDNDYYGKN